MLKLANNVQFTQYSPLNTTLHYGMVYQITNINVLSVTENRLLAVLSLITDSNSPSASHVGLYTTTVQYDNTN